jgi:catechol 2,3-dioxygenase-like lactoylglutathione lyase family enzyme
MIHGWTITRRHFIAGSVLAGAAGTARGEATLPVAGLDHVNIRVPDVRRTAEFYTKLFGVEVSRSPKAGANPGSKPGELWFVRLGQSFLAISPMLPDEKPGIDHFCFAIEGFNGEAMKSKLAELNRQFPDTPANNLWAKDPAGHLVQMSAPASSSRVPGAGVGAVLVEAAGGAKREPAFQATRITELTLAVPKLEPSASYYRKLLGDDTGKPRRGRFRVGQSELVLGPAAGGESFRVGVVGFDPSVTASKLKSLGVAADARNKTSVSFRDTDGIRVYIGG